ncbi:MAG: beta-ketoacyl synthase N-terminal-like domain-containing protein [Bacteroidia bacterium]
MAYYLGNFISLSPADYAQGKANWQWEGGYPVARIPISFPAPAAQEALLYLAETLPYLAFPKHRIGVVIGSARHEWKLLANLHREIPLRFSPWTTGGALSGALACQLGVQGAHFTVSAACNSLLVALDIALAYLEKGTWDIAVVGAVDLAAEVHLAHAIGLLRIYTSHKQFPFVRPFSGENTFALGEGAVLFLVGKNPPNPIWEILDLNIQTFQAETPTQITTENFMSLLSPISTKPDFILCHAPGTRQGDFAELSALQKRFEDVPFYSAKWLTGHTLGASAGTSLEALYYLEKHGTLPLPQTYKSYMRFLERPLYTLITSAGFGGSAGYLLVKSVRA